MDSNKEYPCFLGHYFLKDIDAPIEIDTNGIEHIITKCQRCGKIQILHIDPSKAILK